MAMTSVGEGGLDNDTRGWIMCIVSGIACVFGASIICVDLIIRLLPGKRNFRIQDSNAFLACSLSLSFGVMLFSSLYSMLPEAKRYLKSDDWSDQQAGFLMMGCFVAGFIGIQAVSRILHRYVPSHVVDCDHTHKEGAGHHHHGGFHHAHGQGHDHDQDHGHDEAEDEQPIVETTPLIQSANSSVSRANSNNRHGDATRRSTNTTLAARGRPRVAAADDSRRPSMLEVQKRLVSFVKDTKCNCDELGSCYGYTDPCGQECFKHITQRHVQSARQSTSLRISTVPNLNGSGVEGVDFEAVESPVSPHYRTSRAASRDPFLATENDRLEGEEMESCSSHAEDLEAQHHHHVPTNAFLSIGLQTSIAIALHKFPEGFITYATNHVNPSLGFNVFMALFVHNITEGFAMALPLYMALGSRWRAMAWSALLGGLSQPCGALVAVLWFKLANRTNLQPNAVAYACLFAITAGIMVSVALQLFVESLSFNHNRNLCIFFGFMGMALMGFSSALFAAH